MRILIIDAEKAIRKFLKTTFESHGFSVFQANDGAEALKLSVSCSPDVIILDLDLPDIDGVAVIGRIRERSKTPIIILSNREDENDVIASLDAGADDYVMKPVKVGEMLARIRAVMRRILPESTKAIFISGKLSVDIIKRVVLVKGKLVHLTPIEYNILKILVLHAGKVVSHDLLLKEVWNKSQDFEGIAHLLRVMMSNLRHKIESDQNKPIYILTVPGIGYRLHVFSKKIR